MRRFLTFIVFLCVVLLGAGYFAVHKGWIDNTTYGLAATVIGGLASIIGLLSLARPSISQGDLEDLETTAVTRTLEARQKFIEAERKKSATEQELARLNLMKEEMELFVRKASLVLFLRERLQRRQERISEVVSENKELRELLEVYEAEVARLRELNEEIETDPNVDLLREVVRAASPARRSQPKTFGDFLVREFISMAEMLLGRVVR